MPTPSKQRKYLTEDELRHFFSAVKSVRDRAIFTLAYWRGLRASEIGLLPWSAWDQKKRKVYVFRLKGSLAGEFPFSPAEHKALTAWKEIRGNEPGPMFPSRESSTFTAFEKGKKSAGIGRGMIHVLFVKYATAARPCSGPARRIRSAVPVLGFGFQRSRHVGLRGWWCVGHQSGGPLPARPEA